ncbi:MAG TPA: nucleoside hydrolase [Methanocorpusculum sp.]|nr:nucleoside hydrolase [Methanocorpusculum sp.]
MNTRTPTLAAAALIIIICLLSAGCTTAEEKQTPKEDKPYLVIDTDPGTDDAIAFFLRETLIDTPCMIIGTAGNVPIDLIRENLLLLSDYLDSTTKIAFGASTRLNGDPIYYDGFCGEDGLGNQSDSFIQYSQKKHNLTKEEIENHYNQMVTPYDNIDEIAEELMQHNHITYVLLSPSTTLATLLMKYPQLKEKIDKVYIMGGGFSITNAPHNAEFNMAGDPQADKIVFSSGLDITLLPLDVTMSYVITEEQLKVLEETGKYPEIMGILNYGLQASKATGESDGFQLHDPIALLCALSPADFTFKDTKISIDEYGATKDLGPDAQEGYPIHLATSMVPNTLYKGFLKAFEIEGVNKA